MSTRTIKLKVLTQSALVVIETGVRTLGEFKALPEVQALDLKWNQIKLIDRATKNSIELDSSLLPAIDCIIFVSATKTDSGMCSRSELYSKIADLKNLGVEVPFNVTRTKTSELESFIEKHSACNVDCDSEGTFSEFEVSPISTSEYSATHFADGAILLVPKEAEMPVEDANPADILEELADFITKDELEDEQVSINAELSKRK